MSLQLSTGRALIRGRAILSGHHSSNEDIEFLSPGIPLQLTTLNVSIQFIQDKRDDET
jgi:hypothetical protein